MKYTLCKVYDELENVGCRTRCSNVRDTRYPQPLRLVVRDKPATVTRFSWSCWRSCRVTLWERVSQEGGKKRRKRRRRRKKKKRKHEEILRHRRTNLRNEQLNVLVFDRTDYGFLDSEISYQAIWIVQSSLFFLNSDIWHSEISLTILTIRM